MTTPEPAIVTHQLRKEYGSKVAVAGLDLVVPQGEVFGFLGPNGAGKTTTLKMLLGLVAPTAGSGSLLGVPITDPGARREVGFLPEHFSFHEWLRCDEFLDLHARLYGVPAEVRRRRIPELLALVGLTEAAGRRLGAFSKGMLQRAGLAQALIHEPRLVLLDEPTSGLDPLGRRMVRDVIRHIHERGATVFLNSHLLSEIEITCTRVAFVTDGQVRSTLDLRHQRGRLMRLDLRLGGTADAALLEGLRRWSPAVDQLEDTDGALRLGLQLADEASVPEIVRWLVESGHPVYAVEPRTATLEDLFVEIVGDSACENC